MEGGKAVDAGGTTAALEAASRVEVEARYTELRDFLRF